MKLSKQDVDLFYRLMWDLNALYKALRKVDRATSKVELVLDRAE
ncbi:hypothetical protein KKHLCK_02330 [Candidatus Electrothrix laxa]